MICVCFSPAGACCPLGVKLYRLGPNGIRIYWQASRGSANYSTDLYGSKGIFTCAPSAGLSFCDVTEIPCGDVYTVMVSPVSETGLKLTFCPKKIYSGRAIEPLNPLFKTLNSICESRLRAITLICYVGGQGGVKFSTPCMRILGTGTSSFFGIVMLSYHMIWRHSSLHLLTLSFSEKGPDACCLNSKADLK